MGQYNSTPDLLRVIGDLKRRVQALANSQAIKVYTVATRPSATQVSAGTIIFVSDGGAGAVFQGWTGAAWVNLG